MERASPRIAPHVSDDERRALDWLNGQESAYGLMIPGSMGFEYAKDIRTIKRMLSRPVLPEKIGLKAAEIMLRAFDTSLLDRDFAMLDAYAALYAELTKPKTKTVWKIRGENRNDCRLRDYHADTQEQLAAHVSCLALNGFTSITVHQQEVPTT